MGGFIKGLTRYDKESFGLGNRLFVKIFGNTVISEIKTLEIIFELRLLKGISGL